MNRLPAGLQDALAACLGAPIQGAARVAGGDINDSFAITLANGSQRFVKTHSSPPRGMYQGEAKGLAWLSAAESLRVPEVIAVSPAEAPVQFLVLEYIQSAPKARDHDERLGRGLATLHAASPGEFGLDHDNFIATLLQSNCACGDWPTFYATQRLAPMLKRAVDSRLASAGLERAVTHVIDNMEKLVGPEEPPARLHGDLWGGNVITDAAGWPVLIDPAVYGGHREVDLSMMRLFGGFGTRVFDAYQETFPLSPGYQNRVALYQLYPLLVHANLFGGHYVHSAEQAANRALRGR